MEYFIALLLILVLINSERTITILAAIAKGLSERQSSGKEDAQARNDCFGK